MVPWEYFWRVLKAFGETDKETYVVPGSHEPTSLYCPVVDRAKDKFGNIIDTAEHSIIDCRDHHLVFIPGSDSCPGQNAGNSFTVTNEPKTGTYNTNRGYL